MRTTSSLLTDAAVPAHGTSEQSTSAGIYGVIVGAAVMVASHARGALALAGAVLFTLAIYWAAERYSRLVAARIHGGGRPTWAQVGRELTQGWQIVSATVLPLAVLVATHALGAGLTNATIFALVCSTVLLCLAGWEVGRDGKLSVNERIVSSAVAGLFGAGMIILKALLH
jgi:hypothetical protein